tara:strand:+ start:592 stop:891 length:300 start_codon:yes stop_codon:yes gene_type:complete
MKFNNIIQLIYINLIKFNLLLYLLSISGLFIIPNNNLDLYSSFLKTIVSLFLMIRFNPYGKFKFNKLDRKIVFSAALFLFSTTTVNDFIKYKFNKNIKF